jgi:hypothetical protein
MDLSSAEFRKSTFSGPNGCVEVAFLEDGVAVRDSRNRDGTVLEVSRGDWLAFLRGVKAGEFDLEP